MEGLHRHGNGTQINRVSYAELKREIGTEEIERLRRLWRWCASPRFQPKLDQSCPEEVEPEKWVCRYAPSIITRSEADLFCISLPRFAIRLSLASDKKLFGIVNARRIGTLCDQARRWAKPRAGSKGAERMKLLRAFRSSPSTVLRKNSCVADSVFPRPERFEGWDLLLRPFGVAYGERLREQEEEIFATPFVRHVMLAGGGLCAQATAFMAAALLQDHACGVFGIAEVTALAHGKLEEVERLQLTGLNFAQLADFCNHEEVGLAAYWQQVDAGRRAHEQRKYFALSLRSYLQSKMPVILSLDCQRMDGHGPMTGKAARPTGTSLSATNGSPEEVRVKERSDRNSPHSVILVGCDGEERFAYHDPRGFPYMTGDAQQLMEAAMYTNLSREKLLRCMFLPVTPRPVKLPLESYFIAAEMVDLRRLPPPKPGLMDIARQYIKQRWRSPQGRREVSADEIGSFRLRQLSQVLSAPELNQDLLVRGDGLEMSVAYLIAEKGAAHWVWMQLHDSYVTLWDAELPPLARNSELLSDAILKYRLVTLGYRNLRWNCIDAPAECLEGVREAEARFRQGARGARPDGAGETAQSQSLPADPGPPVRAGRDRFRPGLISSYSMRSFEEALAAWPLPGSSDDSGAGAGAVLTPPLPGVPDLELYAFSQTDAKLLPQSLWDRVRTGWRLATSCLLVSLQNKFRTTVGWDTSRAVKWRKRSKGERPLVFPVTSTLRRLQVAGGILDEPQRIAAQLMSRLEKLPAERRPQISAIATFLPELVAERSEPAVAALRCVIGIAAALRDARWRQPLKVIELVAGSRIAGVWPARERSEKGEPESQAPREVHYVANRISRVAAINRLVGNLAEVAVEAEAAGIRLAFELEPGPLYTLPNLKWLDAFCKVISGADPAINRVVTDERKRAALKRVVGVNLDIAHWAILQQLQPDDVRACPDVCSRIFHAHISDHARGHFGDLVLGQMNQEALFGEWLDLLHEVWSQHDPERLHVSGRVSVELEACREPRFAHLAVEKLAAWI